MIEVEGSPIRRRLHNGCHIGRQPSSGSLIVEGGNTSAPRSQGRRVPGQCHGIGNRGGPRATIMRSSGNRRPIGVHDGLALGQRIGCGLAGGAEHIEPVEPWSRRKRARAIDGAQSGSPAPSQAVATPQSRRPAWTLSYRLRDIGRISRDAIGRERRHVTRSYPGGQANDLHERSRRPAAADHGGRQALDILVEIAPSGIRHDQHVSRPTGGKRVGGHQVRVEGDVCPISRLFEIDACRSRMRTASSPAQRGRPADSRRSQTRAMPDANIASLARHARRLDRYGGDLSAVGISVPRCRQPQWCGAREQQRDPHHPVPGLASMQWNTSSSTLEKFRVTPATVASASPRQPCRWRNGCGPG